MTLNYPYHFRRCTTDRDLICCRRFHHRVCSGINLESGVETDVKAVDDTDELQQSRRAHTSPLIDACQVEVVVAVEGSTERLAGLVLCQANRAQLARPGTTHLVCEPRVEGLDGCPFQAHHWGHYCRCSSHVERNNGGGGERGVVVAARDTLDVDAEVGGEHNGGDEDADGNGDAVV